MMELIKKLNRKDYILWIVVSVIIVMIGLLINIYFLINAPKEMVYNWKDAYSLEDSYVYYGYINQAIEGNFLFRNLFQSDSTPFLFNWFWLVLGFFAGLFKVSAIFIYHFAKAVLVPIALFLIYLFFSFIFNDKERVRVGFLLTSFGAGLGGLLLPIIYKNKLTGYFVTPVDFTPEANPFLTLINSPHLIFAFTLFVFIILNTLIFLENLKYKNAIYSGIAGLLLFQFHPFPLITFSLLFFTYFCYLLCSKNKIVWNFFKYSFLFFLISAPAIYYHIFMIINNPWWDIQMQTNRILTSNIFLLIFIFSIFIILAFIGIKNKQRFKKIDFVFFWLVINLFVAYLPFAFQRRLLEGFYLALVAFAVLGISYLFKKRKISLNKNLIYVLAIFFVVFFYTNVLGLVWRSSFANMREPTFYTSKNLFDAIDWVKYNTDIDDVVLSLGSESNILAGMSLRQVYVGRIAETFDFEKKLSKTKRFFIEMDDNERVNFLDDGDISWILFLDEWKGEGAFDPEEKDFLEKKYQNKDYTLYKYEDSDSSTIL